MVKTNLEKHFQKIVVPRAGVKKGDNGRVLVIGGSGLFHAASFWSAAMASRLVDMVHFSSPTMENNELMRVRAKEKFWEGIVVPWEDLPLQAGVAHYIEEDDTVLIGPGMERGEETKRIVDELITKYPEKKWVVDGGALQEIEVGLLNENHLITPNSKELQILCERSNIEHRTSNIGEMRKTASSLAEQLGGVAVLSKGETDVITNGKEVVEIEGGGGGMVKGGTGDVLSGLVAGLYAKSSGMASLVTASYVNKKAGEKLASQVGPYFSPQQLLETVPGCLWETLER